MNDAPDMLDFVKAMSDADRLRIIGVLTKRSARVAEVASELGMPVRDAFNHLEFLNFVGIVRKTEAIYELDASGLNALSKKQLGDARESYTPAPGLDEKSRQMLGSCLSSDGSIKQIPSRPAKLRVILDYLITAFTPGVNYTEKEVNTILRRFHHDTASLRRYLVDAKMLARESDGSRYWRA